jgi:hypothetical protein
MTDTTYVQQRKTIPGEFYFGAMCHELPIVPSLNGNRVALTDAVLLRVLVTHPLLTLRATSPFIGTRIRQAGSVAHQPASFGHFTHRICRRSMRATPLSREKARGGVVIPHCGELRL